MHTVFHVSHLKKKNGHKKVVVQELPLVGKDGQPRLEQVAVLERRLVKRRNVAPIQWLVRWSNFPDEESSWKGADFIKSHFLAFQP